MPNFSLPRSIFPFGRGFEFPRSDSPPLKLKTRAGCRNHRTNKFPYLSGLGLDCLLQLGLSLRCCSHSRKNCTHPALRACSPDAMNCPTHQFEADQFEVVWDTGSRQVAFVRAYTKYRDSPRLGLAWHSLWPAESKNHRQTQVD